MADVRLLFGTLLGGFGQIATSAAEVLLSGNPAPITAPRPARRPSPRRRSSRRARSPASASPTRRSRPPTAPALQAPALVLAEARAPEQAGQVQAGQVQAGQVQAGQAQAGQALQGQAQAPVFAMPVHSAHGSTPTPTAPALQAPAQVLESVFASRLPVGRLRPLQGMNLPGDAILIALSDEERELNPDAAEATGSAVAPVRHWNRPTLAAARAPEQGSQQSHLVSPPYFSPASYLHSAPLSTHLHQSVAAQLAGLERLLVGSATRPSAHVSTPTPTAPAPVSAPVRAPVRAPEQGSQQLRPHQVRARAFLVRSRACACVCVCKMPLDLQVLQQQLQQLPLQQQQLQQQQQQQLLQQQARLCCVFPP
jgi:hypothetical protein